METENQQADDQNTDAQPAEMSDAEEAQMRSDVMNEVWQDEAQDDAGASAAGGSPDSKADLESMPQAIKDDLTELSLKLQKLEAMEMRLKQAESRVGSIQNQLHAAKAAAPTMSPAEQAEQDKAWADFKEEYPELAPLAAEIEKKIAKGGGGGAVLSSDEVERRVMAVIEERGLATKEQIDEEKAALGVIKEEIKLLKKFPDYEDTVMSSDFRAWIVAQPDNVKAGMSSPYAKDAATVLSAYDKHVKAQGQRKSASDIQRDRMNRLKSSQIVQGRGATIPKSEDGLSDQEIWKQTAKEVWS